MLKNLTFRAKTGLGFALILLVMASIVIFAIRGLQSGSESFTTYRRLARSSVLSGRVQANMLTASKAAKDFLKSRDDKYLEIYDQRFEKAEKFAFEQQAAMQDPQRRELSGALVDNLASYQQANQEVFKLMLRRDDLLEQTLNPQGSRMRKNLSEIMDSAYRDKDSEAAYLAGQTLERVLLGRLYVLKFIDDNEDSDATRVRAELRSGFEEGFKKTVAAIENPRRKELLQEFSSARESYLAAFEEIVLTIQQRNALITNKVQPLDQSIADVSEQIKLSLKADQDKLGPNVQARNSEIIRAVLIGSVIATALAILIATLFARTIDSEMRLTRNAKEDAEQFAAKLQRSRALNQGLLDATESVVYVKDLDGRYILVNQEWTRVMGRSAEETIGATDFDFQPTDVAKVLVENDRQVIELRKPIRFEETPDDASDARVYVSNKFPLIDEDGKVYALGGISTDITELKRQAEALRKSDERFDLTVRGSGDGLWDHDPATGEMWFSDRFRKLLGYGSEQEYPNVAESWSDGLHPDDRDATLHAFASHLESDVPYDVEYRLKTKTNEYRWFRARGISLRDDAGRSYRAAGSITDITQHRHASQALAAAEQRSRSLLESAPDGMMIANEQGRIVIVNAQFEVLFGYTKEEIIGQPIELLMPERSRQKHVGQRTSYFHDPRVRRMGSGMELFAIRKDGSEFPVEISLSPLQTEEGILISSSIRDISERKQAEAQLIEARTAAETANQAKSDFLANMSHEIRTPMNGIMGMTELALGTDLNNEQREFLTTIESSADSLLSLINDILDFSKIEAKRLELDPINFELRERIGDTLSTLAVRAHDKGLELVFDVDPEVPESFVGDIHRIRQVLVNLLGNSIKFTEQGEIVLRIELASQVEQLVTLRFEVKDTGIGLPPEKMETIFQPFEQADVSTTRKYGGTGLGLAICVRLVELMGGEMKVESELGRGTTFSFTADLRIGERMPAKHIATPPKQLRGLRVLVIDDNETNRRILARMLENWGMESVVVDSAAKGLQALQASLGDDPIGLVLSDVNMPEMDGFMFAEEVKNHQEIGKLPIILLTSANRSGDSARCRQLGIAAHLIKPARQSFLFDAIATSIGSEDRDADPSPGDIVTEQSGLEQRGLRLLLAEDNEVNQKFAVRSLKKAGHNVTVANNGQEAVDRWAADSFDAVLMDIQMPVMDGYDATAQIRSREASSSRHTPIIAMTAHAMKGDKEKCLDAGMDGYVTKPIKSKMMFAEIARVLEEFPPLSDSGLPTEPIDDRRV